MPKPTTAVGEGQGERLLLLQCLGGSVITELQDLLPCNQQPLVPEAIGLKHTKIRFGEEERVSEEWRGPIMYGKPTS